MDKQSTPIPLHLYHNVTPERLFAVMEAIDEEYSYEEVEQASRQLTRLRMLKLIDLENKLTDAGNKLLALHRIGSTHALDTLHFIHYAGWHQSQPLENTQLLFYRIYCDYLYDRGEIDLKSRADREKICLDIAEIIRRLDIFSEDKLNYLSLSPDSLSGVHNILEKLIPPVLEDNTFQRRDFCEPAVMLLAFNYALRDDPDALDVNILLSDELREQICRVCLLDPAYFDQTLDWMLPLYPAIISSDPEAGYYGRYVRLKKLPTIEDLLP
ncbi:MAG: hypothetical protein SNJ54_01865 [Anaerolineae bacterium]